MKGCMLNYYFMMDCLKEISPQVLNAFPKEKSIYFNLSNFSSVSSYSFIYNPFKKDKYDIESLIRDHYIDFLTECAILFKSTMEENDSYFIECLIFLYGLITTNTLRDELYPYLKAIQKDDFNLDSSLNILDTYMANKIDKIDLTKVSIYSLFPTAYSYYDSLEELIRNPMVRCFRFMGTNSYFKKSYKRFQKFAKHSHEYKRLFDYKVFDHLYKRKSIHKKVYLLYTKNEDSTLLNLKNETYTINEIEKNDSLEQLMNHAKEKAVSRINALNSYLFIPKGEQEYRNQFHIDIKKKL